MAVIGPKRFARRSATAWFGTRIAIVPSAEIAAFGALAVGRFMSRRLDGITGDVLGAAIEVAELAALLTVSAWMHARL